MKHTPLKIYLFSLVAIIAFAANSVLCRLALYDDAIDAASFTLIRLVSGASTLVLLSIYMYKTEKPKDIFGQGDWISSFALFIYAAGFSFAYIALPTGLGALLLFGSVQVTMMLVSLLSGERLTNIQWFGFIIAIIGLVYLLFPDSATIPTDSNAEWLLASVLMICAGIAWGVYSIKGKRVKNATLSTTDNFVRAGVTALILFAVYILSSPHLYLSKQGVVLAIVSGAITSGLGYAIWYSVLPYLKGTSAASMQLSVPVFASVAGVLFLSEAISLSIILATIMILGGVGLVIRHK